MKILCAATGKRHDPCVIDVFMSAVHFMDGGEPLPWWSFTQERKKAYNSARADTILNEVFETQVNQLKKM